MAEICSDALFIPQGITSSLGSIAGFSSMTIKASPEIMEAKAADVLSAAAQIRREFEELFRAMGRTAGYWNGEAAEAASEKICRHEAPNGKHAQVLGRTRQ